MTQQKIYAAYLKDFQEKNKNAKAPEISSDLVKGHGYEWGQEVLSRSSKFWGEAVKVYRLEDGRIAESMTGRFENPVAIFDSYEHWVNYETPKCFAAFFDNW